MICIQRKDLLVNILKRAIAVHIASNFSSLFLCSKFVSFTFFGLLIPLGKRGSLMVEHQTPNREVLGSISKLPQVPCWVFEQDILTPLVNAQEAVALFQHDRENVYWDVKLQYKQDYTYLLALCHKIYQHVLLSTCILCSCFILNLSCGCRVKS